MTTLAAIRPDNVNFPLFLHVLGAMLLVGLLLAIASAVVLGWRRTDPEASVGLTRMALWTLILGVFPSYLLMRIGAQWTASEEGLDDAELTWIDIGYITADLGAVLVLISIVLSIIGLRRTRRGGGVGLGRAVGIISVLLLVASVIAVWAMTVKPD